MMNRYRSYGDLLPEEGTEKELAEARLAIKELEEKQGSSKTKSFLFGMLVGTIVIGIAAVIIK